MQIIMLKDDLLYCGYSSKAVKKGEVHSVPDSIAVHLIRRGIAKEFKGEILTSEVEK